MKKKKAIGDIMDINGIDIKDLNFNELEHYISVLQELKEDKAKEIIDMLGAERFFFATDFPMWDANRELERL